MSFSRRFLHGAWLALLFATLTSCQSKPLNGCDICESTATCETATSGPASGVDAGDVTSCMAAGFIYYGTRDLVISVAWSPVDDYVLSGADGEVRLLQAHEDSGTLSDLDVYTGQGGRTFVAWSGDGKFALSAAKDVRLLDISRQTATISDIATFSGHVGDIYAVSVAPDNAHALSAGEDSTLRLLNVDTASASLTELTRFDAQAGKIYGLAWSPDGKYAATAGEDGTARLYSVDTAEPALREVAHVTRSEWVVAVDWSVRDGDWLIGTWGKCNAVQLLAPDPQASSIRLEDTFLGHTSGARTAHFRADGAYAVTAGHDDTVRLFARAAGSPKLEPVAFLPNNRFGVHDTSFSPDGKVLLVAASHVDQLTWVDVSACVGTP
jgi:WD40 repeat protein